MKEINIGKVLITKRKEKGITQDELASYIGVSKASVSKWETGQSYPDITFLPQLATYFNISIDDLIGYTPQMNREEIRKLYRRLADKFVAEPFAQVYGECEKIIKKYYACFPLLLQMSILYLNHYMLAEEEKKTQILEQALHLCQRAKNESDDILISKEAAMMEGVCLLTLNRPAEVLELFGETLRPIAQETETIAQAHLFMGNMEKANVATQVSIYQHMLIFIGASLQLFTMSFQEPDRAEMILHRIWGVADLFQIKDLHPNTMAMICLTGAQFYCGQGETEKALSMLDEYVAVCKSFFPAELHGDKFFNSIDEWLQNELDLGSQVPRSEEAIKKSLIQSVVENPAYAPLSEMPEFKAIIARIKTILGGN